jgi:hypothetical protein
VGERALVTVQQLVVRALQEPAPLRPTCDVAMEMVALVTPSARGMTPTERVEVYRDQYWIRHLHNLAEDYPTLTWSVGGAVEFEALGREYLRAHPPVTWNLQRLGERVPAFVAAHARWAGHALSRDAARIDWAFMEVFDAADAPSLDPRVLASAPEDAWPGARLGFPPALRILALAYPLHEVRDALKRGESPEQPTPGDTRLVVWRDAACFLHAVSIEAGAFDLLLALRDGAPLGEACETAARTTGLGLDAMGSRLGGWFQDWTQRGWVSSVRFGS